MFSSENVSRSARRDVFSIASGKSRKSSRISRSLFKWRSAFCVSNFPAASRCVCSRMQVKTSSDFAPVRFGVLHAVCRQDRQSIMRGKIDKLPVDAFFAAQKVPLNFNENIFAAESVDQKLRAIGRVLGSARALACPVRRPPDGSVCGKLPARAAGSLRSQSKERNQPLRRIAAAHSIAPRICLFRCADALASAARKDFCSRFGSRRAPEE